MIYAASILSLFTFLFRCTFVLNFFDNFHIIILQVTTIQYNQDAHFHRCYFVRYRGCCCPRSCYANLVSHQVTFIYSCTLKEHITTISSRKPAEGIDARGLSLLSAGKSLAGGVVTGAALTGIEDILGGSNSTK
jgi:hypothetical protein